MSIHHAAFGKLCMHPISAQIFYSTSADVQKIRTLLEVFISNKSAASNVLDQEDKDILFAHLKALNDELVKFECRAALATLGKFGAMMEGNTLNYAGAVNLIDELDGRIRDELQFVTAFTLTAQEASIFSPTEPLIHKDFPTQFPSAVFDLEESAKCMALGRATAAVFHAMRVLEMGVDAIGLCLGIPKPIDPRQRSWGNILKAIDDALKAKWPSAADREDGDGHLFEALHTTLTGIKNVWRNKTMHPAQKYTPEEAARIITVTTHLMQELLYRADEKGLPLA